MQIVSFGAQDMYLTGKPQITFFKLTYRRHTNFAIESISNVFNGSTTFGGKANCTIQRSGDLLWRTYLQFDLPALSQSSGTVAWTRNVGHAILKSVELEIGSQRIDKQYGDFMTIWNELTMPEEKRDGYSVMIGNTTALTTQAASISSQTLYVPLQFWFCMNPGLALPLIALQYHDVRMAFEFRAASECYITDDGAAPSSGTPALTNMALWCDYIFLDTFERESFTKTTHEYLITQLQYTGEESVTSSSTNVRLSFNHPTKFLAWVVQPDANVASNVNEWSNFTLSTGYNGADTVSTAKLLLNSHERFYVREGRYFNLVQPWQHFPRVPATGIYVYSFCLNPVEYQPSGSVNMSRIDNATLQLTTATSAAKLRIYALSYNVLRIMSGMAGVAYAN